MSTERREHWERVYRTKPDDQLSWYQERPEPSLEMIRAIEPRPRSVIDIGGGQSALASELLSCGVERVAVLDISGAALERARERLADFGERVEWVCADVLDDPALGEYELWHDRAVFHFLTTPDQRDRYVRKACETVTPGGHVVVGTFALSGPERCSGLDVVRYSAESLAEAFGERFTLEQSREHTHETPWRKAQDFVFVALRYTP